MEAVGIMMLLQRLLLSAKMRKPQLAEIEQQSSLTGAAPFLNFRVFSVLFVLLSYDQQQTVSDIGRSVCTSTWILTDENNDLHSLSLDVIRFDTTVRKL
jgi:hypothetical protein